MTLYRNTSDLPIDIGDRQVYSQADVDLSPDQVSQSQVSAHIEQGTLVAVTLATVPVAPPLPAAVDLPVTLNE